MPPGMQGRALWCIPGSARDCCAQSVGWPWGVHGVIGVYGGYRDIWRYRGIWGYRDIWGYKGVREYRDIWGYRGIWGCRGIWGYRSLGLCRVVCPGQGSPRDSGWGRGRQSLEVIVVVMASLVLAPSFSCHGSTWMKSFLTSVSTAQHDVLGLCFGNKYPAHTFQKVCACGCTAKTSLHGGLDIQSAQERVSQRPMFHVELQDVDAVGRSSTSSLCFLCWASPMFEKAQDTQALWKSPGVVLLLGFSC